MPIILALGNVKQENWEFTDSLGYTVKPCLKNKIKLYIV
jgi:hypothetical protein